jgi:hypothetical protein
MVFYELVTMATAFAASVTTIASTVATATTASAFSAKHIQCALDFFVCSWA